MELRVQGKRVYAHTGGQDFDPAKPAVVFVHGAGMDHTVWGLQARYVAHHGRSVLSVDLPGHGRSEGPALASIDAVADWIAALIDAAGAKNATLVGHSMGALASLNAAARHPARVARLVLCGVAGKMPVHPDLIQAAEKDPGLARDLIVDWGFGGRGRIGGNTAVGLWLSTTAQRLIDRAASGVLATDLKACDAYGDGEADAAKVACPALLVLGEADRMTPAKAGRALAQAIKGAEAIAIADCGHMMMVEQPDATLDALTGFLGRP
ncbi:MAG: alpha/beta hydrolase [Rhodospirillales bacterium]|nr:alpha/beta hydrolase [Rhodospirillales bacterium]